MKNVRPWLFAGAAVATLVCIVASLARETPRPPTPAPGADAAGAFRGAPIEAMGGAPGAKRLAADYTVCLQPLGPHDETLIGPVGRGVALAYGFTVRTLDPRPLPAMAWYPPRGRHRAQLLLDYLKSDVIRGEPACDAVVGFTGGDVSITKGEHPDWGVLGLAYLGDHVAVVSSFRMRRGADRQRLVARAVKVVIHELGHVIGLPHRTDGPACIMNDAGGSVQVVDQALGSLCGAERAAAEALLDMTLPANPLLDWDAIQRD